MSFKSNTNASLALFLSINLLLFALVFAGCHNSPPSPITKPKHKTKHKHKSPKSSPSPPEYSFLPPPNPYISPVPPVPYLSPPNSYFPSPPNSYFPSPPKALPSPPTPYFSSPKAETCPRDALKLEVCADVLGGLIGVIGGTPPKQPCCRLFGGLVDFEAAVCLCTAIKANVLGVNLDVPLSLSLILNVCDMNVPPGFQCA